MERTKENIVSSYFYYMWNRWSKVECETVFGNMAGHFWAKWCGLSSPSLSGAAERFYAELGNNAQLAKRLDFDATGRFGENDVGWIGR